MFEEDFERFGPFGGGRMRAGRGMMEPAILRTLLDKPMHGYEIISSIEERSHGLWRPSAGSVYPTLQLLEEKEFVTSANESGKKVYSLTDAGREAAEATRPEYVEAWRNRSHAFQNAHGFQNMREFRGEFSKAIRPMRAIMRKGSDAQRNELMQAVRAFTTRVNEIEKEKN